jgi:hypothetical protein
MSTSRPGPRPWRREFRFVSAFVITLAALTTNILVPARANADPFGGQAGGYPDVADGQDHWYCFHSSVAAGDQSRFHSAMQTLDSQTDLYDVYTATCGASTDIIFMSNPNLTARGIAVCWTYISGNICDQFWVGYNTTVIAADVGANSAGFSINFNKTICHETGHTTGLSHGVINDPEGDSGGNDCMVSGDVYDAGFYNFVWTAYSGHHVTHVNNRY